MGLRIRTNTVAQKVQKNLRTQGAESDKALERLSSGKRINKSADDAAGLAIAKSMESQNRGLQMAKKNSSNGIALVQVAEGGLNEVSNILTRLRELTIQASSDTVGDKERGYLDLEYQQLTTEADRIANSTVFNGASLLNGESGRGVMEFQVGVFAGEQNRIQFDADAANATTSALGVDGLSISEKDDALDAIERLDEAQTNVAGQRALLGSVQSRLQSTVSNLETQYVNQESARSTLEDADIALESARLASSQVIKSAGVSSLSQANGISNAALRLVG